MTPRKRATLPPQNEELHIMSFNKPTRRSLRASAPRFLEPLQVRDDCAVRTLECRVDGYPRPDIRWERSGRPVGKSRKLHMTRSGDRCLLQIRLPCTSEECGTYTCVATNNVGTAQTRVSCLGMDSLKVNGSSHSSPILSKTAGIRSRSTERTSDSVQESRHHLSVTKLLPESDSRKPPRPSAPKSKLSTFTSHIWNKDDQVEAQRTTCPSNHMDANKKQLSKSMDDCRKHKRNFLTRVMIPDIFTSTKSLKVNNSRIEIPCPQKENRNGEIKTNGEIRPNSNFDNKIIKDKKIPNGVKSNGRINAPVQNEVDEAAIQLTTRERIAAYLKRFENSTSSVKSKDSRIEHDRMSKRGVGSEKKRLPYAEPKTSHHSRNERFSFSKFRRRKSSSEGNKNNCVENDRIEETTPDRQRNRKCHVVETESSRDLEEQRDGDNSSRTCVNGTLKLKDIYGYVNITPDVDLMCQTVTDNNVKIEKPDTPQNLEVVNRLTECSKRLSDLGSFESIDMSLMDTFKDFPKELNTTNVDNESLTDCKTTVSALVSDEVERELKESVVPLIYIEQSPECNDTNDECELDPIQAIINDRTEAEQALTYSSLRKPSTGKIKYSSPLVEEECEILVEEGDRERRSATPETDPQRVSSPIECPARIVKGPQSVTVLRGESVTLAISFNGHPTPKVTWMKGGRVLREEKGGRLSILEGKEMSVVTVNDVTADDSGKYVVSAENEGGGDSCFASVAVVGFPEPPGSEPTASEVTDHSLVVSWYGSMYDGGSVVTGYQVEMCTLPDANWHKVASSVNTSCSVLGLSKGQKYLFRVRAENKYGPSHPSKESKVIRLDDFLQEESSSDEDMGEESSAPITVEIGTNFKERFDLKEEVGKGRFGTVYRCVEVECGRPRAAKVIRCLKMKDKEKVRQEIDIMSRLHHPKLMQVLAAFESGKNMIMVMEFISGGELFERVIADDFVLTEQDCILFMRQICDGVVYMHTNHVIHLDLKPENILCKTRSSHKIKIIDFGLARVYKDDESLRVLFGTPEFVAPEVINYEPVCPASDMWSVGVICYVLLSGLSPFMGDSDTETFANITRGEMDFDDDAFEEISVDAKDFISQLLVKQVRNRLSAEECLKHPWLATGGSQQKRPLSTEKLKRFIIRRKWQKSGTAIRALGRMVGLSRSSLGSSCDSYSPLGSPTSSRSRSSLVSRSETAESGESDVFQER